MIGTSHLLIALLIAAAQSTADDRPPVKIPQTSVWGGIKYDPLGGSCKVTQSSGLHWLDAKLCRFIKQCASKHPNGPKEVDECMKRSIGAQVIRRKNDAED